MLPSLLRRGELCESTIGEDGPFEKSKLGLNVALSKLELMVPLLVESPWDMSLSENGSDEDGD